MAGSYTAAMNYARNTGQAGRIVPTGGSGTGIKYRFVPTGGSMRGGAMGGTGGLTDAARSAFQSAIGLLGPNGQFMSGIEAGLDRGRTKALASGMSGLVQAGLSNTTQAAGLGKKYEEEVAAPTRASATSDRIRQLASLYAALGGAEQSAFESGANRQQNMFQTVAANRPASNYGQYRPLPSLLGSGGGSRTTVPTSPPGLFTQNTTTGTTQNTTTGTPYKRPNIQFAPFSAAERAGAQTNLANMSNIRLPGSVQSFSGQRGIVY